MNILVLCFTIRQVKLTKSKIITLIYCLFKKVHELEKFLRFIKY